MNNCLDIVDLWFHYGSIPVTKGVSLAIEVGERHAIIGPNGAGKTTFFHLLTGLRKPGRGRVMLFGEDVTGAHADDLVACGLTRSFQITSLFRGLTVRENLRIGVQALRRHRYNLFFAAPSYREVERKVEEVAHLMRLADCLERRIQELSYGQARQLEVCMALASEPKVVLLDEPAAGTSVAERTLLVDLIAGLPRETTVLLVEHDMDIVFSLSDRISVLSYGELIASGRPEEIRADETVQSAYLGKPRAEG